MKTTYLIVAVGISMMMALSGCSTSPTPAARMTSDELERLVSGKINGDPQLTAYNINVSGDMDNNAVTLSGEVPTESLRTRAVELARSGRNDLVVTSKIDVKPADVELKDYSEDMARETRDSAKVAGESVGDSLSDAWIHTKVRTKLLKEGEFPGGSLNVDVKNNVVTLRGDVSTQAEKVKAADIAKSIDGVKVVNNRLAVKPKV